MKTLNLKPGDYVSVKSKEKTWQGNVLESHDPEIVLLKLDSGYNIGIRENSILSAEVKKESEDVTKESLKLPRNKELPNVAMIITGGTISSRLDPKSGAVKWTSVEDLFKIAPELSKICNITQIKKPFMKGTEDMSFKDWKKIADTATKLLNDPKIDGLIITHGTDILHYTAAAISFFLKNLNKPVAVTYSQRSIDRGSTDAHLNLICAAKYATSEVAEVAIIGHKDLNDKVCVALPATKTKKSHTSRRDTFQVINDTPIAEISKENLKILKEFKVKDVNKKVELDAKSFEKVALVKFIPGMSPAVLEFYAKSGYKGIVIEATGLGHVATNASDNNWLPTIKKLIKKGVTICVAPQTANGRLNLNVYSNGRKLKDTGVIVLGDMLPETALVKLSWALGHPSWARDKEKIRDKMLENVAGEFNEKLGVDGFGC
ncbi:Glu-tRNA(Gln) amidotransferase GatDE subunit D [Candidatus Pacearchaeota archaeon]|nr:Glu-tRNA(Gln) amidotransferase GatDE subunit D [Candidatus Pacearchaeota archaeon]|tara:strand:- start:1393 stop:2688 length:1296 start_codon:yes stop_codon:yes gene_type:complete